MSWFKERAAAEKLLMKKKTPRRCCGGVFSVGPLDLAAENRLYICRLSTTKKYYFSVDIYRTAVVGILYRPAIHEQITSLQNSLTSSEYSKILQKYK
jgi:hypothetical protein